MTSSIHSVFLLASTLFDFVWSAHAIWFVGWLGFAAALYTDPPKISREQRSNEPAKAKPVEGRRSV